MKKLTCILAALALLILTGGLTRIARAQTGETILGCVASSGIIRSVDEATGSCRPGDVALSWYTKSGANNVFLGKTAKAADSDELDGLDSSAFVKNGDAAGGALIGTYPSPFLADNAVHTGAIQNAAVTAEKLAPGVGLRSFGSTMTLGGSLTPTVDCTGNEDKGSTTITVNSTSLIYGQASVARWSRGTTAISVISVIAILYDATDTTRLAQTPEPATMSVPVEANYFVSGSSSGILVRYDNLGPFIAAPGTYKLHFFVLPAGSCQAGQTSFLDGSLTYILLGTSP
jgi:hypothetical protein